MAALTPVQKALLALGRHCAGCPDCRTVWRGETPIRRSCPSSDALYEKLRQSHRTERTA